MDTPVPNNIEHSPAQNTEFLRMAKLAELRGEMKALEAKMHAIEQELHRLQDEPRSLFNFGSHADSSSAILRPEEKIAFFLELFGARRDVYPKFWENPASGKKGYSPAYISDHAAGRTGKRFLPLDKRAVEAHLRGTQAIGVYALRQDDSCIFLAADDR